MSGSWDLPAAAAEALLARCRAMGALLSSACMLTQPRLANTLRRVLRCWPVCGTGMWCSYWGMACVGSMAAWCSRIFR